MSYFMIFVSAIFVNNIVLSQFLGICPFLGVSKKVSTAVGMSGAVSFVMVLATIVTYIIYHAVLIPYHLEFMIIVTFILVISSLVQMVEIMLKKTAPVLYKALGVFLPLITTNCTVLGVSLLVIQRNFDLMHAVCFALANSLGFSLAIVLFAGLRERLAFVSLPKAVQGAPIALITAGLLSMAFMGFSGIGN